MAVCCEEHFLLVDVLLYVRFLLLHRVPIVSCKHSPASMVVLRELALIRERTTS
jgi:hypothetical protein